jgi:uncharacterized protein YutE (UPF0331/DUF86 family)
MGLAGLEYRAVARLSSQHGLIDGDELAERFSAMAGYRNRLTHHYEEITPEELFGILTERLGDISSIAESLRRAAAALAGDRD